MNTPVDVGALMLRIGYTGKVEHNCHTVSLAIVQSGIYPGARVARGACIGVMGQHSWVTLGDPYDEDAPIIDATLWSYDESVTGIWTGTIGDRHQPHGAGHLFQAGMPENHGGPRVRLTPKTPLSPMAERFLSMLGPLDLRGWMQVAHLPVGGWPAGEILAAMDDTPSLAAFIPLDRLGMTTKRNPNGLYLHPDDEERSNPG